MKIITDEILHLYIINSLLVDKELKEEIEKRVTVDPEFKERIDWVKKFHKEFKSQSKPEGIIALYPMKPVESSLRYPKLAAANVKEKENVFKYFASFISADNVIIVRIQKNEATNEFKIHLITESPVDFSKVRIYLGGYQREIIPDSRGTALVNDFNIDLNTNIHINLGSEN